jgi:undecaprenyl diphosphate synthase
MAQFKQTLTSHIIHHLAIILDGNGRWAKQKGMPRLKGHQAGAKAVIDVADEARKQGIKVLSLFVFSTENWKRSEAEIKGIFDLLSTFMKQYESKLIEEKVKLVISGDLSLIPLSISNHLQTLIEKTAKFDGPILNICLNYGGLQEVTHMTKQVAAAVKANVLKVDDINIDTILQHTFVPNLPPIDLLIRTSGERRISNFMLLHLAYAELIFIDTHWPDFTKETLLTCLEEYSNRKRRFGAVT